MSLIAVSASSNRSKGASDPSEWMPPTTSFKCEYVYSWIQVKLRWQLSVDPAEASALKNNWAGCSVDDLDLAGQASGATIGTAPETQPAPEPAPEPAPDAGNAGDTDPRFSSCTKAKAEGFGPYQSGIDPEYGWYTDRDQDGLVCE
jgi:hypothetical protein